MQVDSAGLAHENWIKRDKDGIDLVSLSHNVSIAFQTPISGKVEPGMGVNFRERTFLPKTVPLHPTKKMDGALRFSSLLQANVLVLGCLFQRIARGPAVQCRQGRGSKQCVECTDIMKVPPVQDFSCTGGAAFYWCAVYRLLPDETAVESVSVRERAIFCRKSAMH